jgi:hypothetical protein
MFVIFISVISVFDSHFLLFVCKEPRSGLRSGFGKSRLRRSDDRSAISANSYSTVLGSMPLPPTTMTRIVENSRTQNLTINLGKVCGIDLRTISSLITYLAMFGFLGDNGFGRRAIGLGSPTITRHVSHFPTFLTLMRKKSGTNDSFTSFVAPNVMRSIFFSRQPSIPANRTEREFTSDTSTFHLRKELLCRYILQTVGNGTQNLGEI